MKASELKELFGGDEKASASLIKYQDNYGIVIQLGNNLSPAWQSGDLIVFWENGEHTIVPGDEGDDGDKEFELLVPGLFRVWMNIFKPGD